MSSEVDPDSLGPPGTGPDTAAIPKLTPPEPGDARRRLAGPTDAGPVDAGPVNATSGPEAQADVESTAWGPAPTAQSTETRRHLGIAAIAVTAALAVAVGLAMITNAVGEPVSRQEPVTSGTPTVTATVVSPTTTATSPTGSNTSDSAATGQVKFTSPSGNINCTLSETQVRCDLKSQSWPSKKPRECRSSTQLGALLTAKSAKIVCEDHQYGGRRLAYGEKITRGEFSCESTKLAVRCVHSGGREFAVAHDWVKFNAAAAA